MSDIPYHLSEKQFRKFEHVIAKAVKLFPAVLACGTGGSGYSANSYAARLRDAIASYRKYGWPSDMLPSLLCTEKLGVSLKDGVVYLGSKDELKKSSKPQLEEPTTKFNLEPIMLSTPGEKVILCKLASLRVLTQPIPVKGLGFYTILGNPDIEWLMDNFDVTITKQTNDIYLIQ